MHNQYHLFHEVGPFYETLWNLISKAKKSISMLYLIYDQGVWADRLNEVLITQALSGIKVRIMADYLGTITDHPLNLINNLRMVKQLKRAGLEVTLFNPAGPRMSFLDRLHIKMCAIDENYLFLGGSNIGDYYLDWQDTNLLIDGTLGNIGHDLFDFVRSRSKDRPYSAVPEMDLPTSCIGDARVILTVPGSRRDIYRCIVSLVLNAHSPIYFRYWYFLPPKELLNALLSQLENGLQLNIMVSNSTRVPIIDLANRITLKKLKLSGATIFRYKKRNMHSKIAWTEDGEIILGSANIENRGLANNFELCVGLHDPVLAEELSGNFWRDSQKE